MILYANIKSFTILKNRKAKRRNMVNAAKLYNHGTIFFSYSLRNAVISINEVIKTTIPPIMENKAKTIRALRTC